MSERETALKEPCPHCGRTDYRWTHEFRVGMFASPDDRLEMRCDYCRPLRMDAYYFGFSETGVEAIDRILSAVAQAGKGYHHTESWGDDGLDDMGEFRGGSYVAWIQNAANDAAELLSLGDAPQTGASPQADVTCEHGTAMDVHCCHCHSGFVFDANHECPALELTWREAVEQALGVENDTENHSPSWAFDVVRAAREIGNAPTSASPQAEPQTCQWREIATAPDGDYSREPFPVLVYGPRLGIYRGRAVRMSDGYVHADVAHVNGNSAESGLITHWQPLPAPPVALVPAEGDR